MTYSPSQSTRHQEVADQQAQAGHADGIELEQEDLQAGGRGGGGGQEETAVNAGAVGALQVGGVERDRLRLDPVAQLAEEGQQVIRGTGQAQIFRGQVTRASHVLLMCRTPDTSKMLPHFSGISIPLSAQCANPGGKAHEE